MQLGDDRASVNARDALLRAMSPEQLSTLAQRLLDARRSLGAAFGAPTSRTAAVTSTVARAPFASHASVDGLSDDEVASLLAEMLGSERPAEAPAPEPQPSGELDVSTLDDEQVLALLTGYMLDENQT